MAQNDDAEKADEIEAQYSRVAPLYDMIDWPFEWARYRRLRRLLCHGLTGRVLEAGVGTGRNLPYYPPGTAITGIDLSAAMLARARRRPLRAGIDVGLVHGDVTATGFDSARFDAVTASFLLCVLPHTIRAAALTELARACRPHGEIRLIEYQRSQIAWRSALQTLWTPYVRWAFGADFDLDLDGLIEQSGVSVIESRYVVGDIIRYLRLRPMQAQA